MSISAKRSKPPAAASLWGDEAPAQSTSATLWSLVNTRLQGRWRVAVILGIVLAGFLGPLGYFSTVPKYRSVGYIRIAPKIEPILRETSETGVMPLYQNFVQTQASLLNSQRVLENALRDERLAKMNVTIEQLRKGLSAKAEQRTELLTVSFDADSPNIAQMAVNAIIISYYEIFGSAGGEKLTENLKTLQDNRDGLRAQIQQRESELADHAGESVYGTGDVDTLINRRVEELDVLESQIEQIENILAALGQPATEGVQSDPGTLQAPAPTPQQLDGFDPELKALRSALAAAVFDFEQARERWKPIHPEYQRRQQRLSVIQQRFEEREAVVRSEWEAARLQSFLLLQYADPKVWREKGIEAYQSLSPAEIQTMLEWFRRAASDARDAIKAMVEHKRLRDELRSKVEFLKQDLAEIEDRIMHLGIEKESVSRGRISVAQYGDLPTRPVGDRRRVLAGVGVAAGFGLSIGFFFLLGAIDQRAFRTYQLRAMRIPRCLGVLPDLSRGTPDSETCTIAAHCVHQIRNHIDALREARSGYVLAVSSPYQGDGKTNIVTALGWSCATAGTRTLLIDCDFTGQGLTHLMGMGGKPGLKDVFREGRVNGQIIPHRIANLSVLPAGCDPDIGPEAVRRSDLEAILPDLRRQFDLIIMDTGPILASLEGIPVASAADNTILSIRRGRRRTMLEESVERLRAVGVRCLGVVLNYASRVDCDRYVSESSLSLPRVESEKRTSDDPSGVLPIEVTLEQSERSALIRAMTAASSQARSGGRPGS